MRELPRAKQAEPKQMQKRLSLTSSVSAPGSFHDMKRNTSFIGSADGGILKKTALQKHVSKYRSAPRCTMGGRTEAILFRSNDSPAPGSYSGKTGTDKLKFNAVPSFSLGKTDRWGPSCESLMDPPGPGAHSPKDVTKTNLRCSLGVGERSQPWGDGNVDAPGPGAYEIKTLMGTGRVSTAKFRLPDLKLRQSRKEPGPGAYTPSKAYSLTQQPQWVFGSEKRPDIGANPGRGPTPAPGAYETHNMKNTRHNNPPRVIIAGQCQKVGTMQSYIYPGPGTYNEDLTSFEPLHNQEPEAQVSA